MNCFKFLALDGALQFLEYYMEKGGFLNSINTDGNSPLLVLLKNHSRINDERQKKEVQIANIAAYFMKNTTSQILDKHGNSPLHVAVEAGMVKTVEALLASGAIASKQNQQGRTALHLCLEKRKFFLKLYLQKNVYNLIIVYIYLYRLKKTYILFPLLLSTAATQRRT